MLVTTQSTEVYAKKEAGGKGFNLYLMSQNHLPVPEWVIFGTRYLERFLQETQIYTSLQQKIKQFENNEITEQEIFEIIGLISLKTISNYVNNYLTSVKRKHLVNAKVV